LILMVSVIIVNNILIIVRIEHCKIKANKSKNKKVHI
jgi:hypothetical protein